jgi:hypothetical protein
LDFRANDRAILSGSFLAGHMYRWQPITRQLGPKHLEVSMLEDSREQARELLLFSDGALVPLGAQCAATCAMTVKQRSGQVAHVFETLLRIGRSAQDARCSSEEVVKRVKCALGRGLSAQHTWKQSYREHHPDGQTVTQFPSLPASDSDTPLLPVGLRGWLATEVCDRTRLVHHAPRSV